MGMIAGTVVDDSGPVNGLAVKLWPGDSFAATPEKGDALPVGSPLDTATSGVAYGGDGAFQFRGLPSGDYYVSVEGVVDGPAYMPYDVAGSRARVYDITDFGAIGEGVLVTLADRKMDGSEPGYASLLDAQEDFPAATALTESINWAAFQHCNNLAEDSGVGGPHPGWTLRLA
jgi:hypothetical protein